MKRALASVLLWLALTGGAIAYEARVYGLRGLLGGVLGYSLGIDTVLGKAAAQNNVKTYIKPHYRWREFAATARANWKRDKLPIMLVGHSLGADALSYIAADLARDDIPVTLSLYYDPTPGVQPVPINVRRAVDYRQNVLFNLGQGIISFATGFLGTGQVFTGRVAHIALDDDPGVHAASLCEIKAAIAKSPIVTCSWATGVASGPAASRWVVPVSAPYISSSNIDGK